MTPKLAQVETKQDRRLRLQEMIAFALHETTRAEGSPHWDAAAPVTLEDCRAHARGAQRQMDPMIRMVAEEMAAQAFATVQQWDWPSLWGYPVDPQKNRELVLTKVRQQIRNLAREMCRAYVKHLELGNPLDQARLDEQAAHDLQAQRLMDDERKRELEGNAPAPWTVFDGGRTVEADPRD